MPTLRNSGKFRGLSSIVDLINGFPKVWQKQNGAKIFEGKKIREQMAPDSVDVSTSIRIECGAIGPVLPKIGSLLRSKCTLNGKFRLRNLLETPYLRGSKITVLVNP
jgi:hypothetical protein